MNSHLSHQMMQAHTAELHRVAAEHRRAAELERPTVFSRARAALPKLTLHRNRVARPAAPAPAPASQS